MTLRENNFKQNLNLLTRNGTYNLMANISIKEIRKSVGLGTTTITKRIHCLKEAGIVARKGPRKTGQWIVKQ